MPYHKPVVCDMVNLTRVVGTNSVGVPFTVYLITGCIRGPFKTKSEKIQRLHRIGEGMIEFIDYFF